MSHEDLALLEVLEAREATARRRAVWVAWSSVFVAAVVLASLVFSAYRQLAQANRQLAVVHQQVEAGQARVKELQAEEERLRRQIANYERIEENYRTIAAQQSVAISKPERPPDVDKQIQPRVYLQIVSREDDAYAQRIGQRLEEAGFDVLGTEYVPRAAGLKHTEVRYYKKADEEGAQALLRALQNATGAPVTLVYLGLEENTRVRPKHYEVWFAAGAGSAPRQPLLAPRRPVAPRRRVQAQ